MRIHLNTIVEFLFSTAPLLIEMRGHPEFKGWGKQVIAIGNAKDLKPIQPLLKAFVEDSFVTLQPLSDFLQKAKEIPLENYLKISEIAEREVDKNPYAAFVLSAISLLGWVKLLRNDLYDLSVVPITPGWEIVPYAAALTSFKLGMLEVPKLLVHEAYDMLMGSKDTTAPVITLALSRYRFLARRIQGKYEIQINNLADELRDSCRHKENNFRAEVGSLLWSLGAIPESQAFNSTSDSSILPTRRLCRWIVRQVVQSIPNDPINKHLLYEMKGRLPFDIAEYSALFENIHKNVIFQPDEDLSIPPTQLHAKCLINCFKGTISQEQANEYLTIYRDIKWPENIFAWSIYVRMAALVYIIGNKYGYFLETISEEETLKVWHFQNSRACNVRQSYDLNPNWPHLHGRLNWSIMELIETVFSKYRNTSLPNSAEIERAVKTMENFRASALSYWLTVNPPKSLQEKDADMHPLLEKEKELMEYLRGAYFLILKPLLPRHYSLFSMVIEDMLPVWDNPSQKLDPEFGRQQFIEIKTELIALFKEMKKIDPNYAEKRLSPEASMKKLIKSINNHAVSR